MVKRAWVLGISLVCWVGWWPSPAHAQHGATNGEWRSYGGDLGSTKYSPLDQIDRTNFGQLEIAWRWQSVDGALDLEALRQTRPEIGIRSLKATPLMVGGVLYISTPLHQAAAIDAGTGETLWVYDPQSYLGAPYPHGDILSFNSRGLAYWTDGREERLLWGDNEAYLHAVDARTGIPIRDFGDNGRVDLSEGIPRAQRGTTDSRGYSWLGVASPPIIAHDVVVTPTIVNDFSTVKEAPPGWVKGIDVRTGETKWTFRTVPQADDFGSETWLNESWRYSGNTNVWSLMSVDDELGYVYLPTGTPTGDYYGGHRLGDNLFAESLVALDIETGERIWHFQMVYHPALRWRIKTCDGPRNERMSNPSVVFPRSEGIDLSVWPPRYDRHYHPDEEAEYWFPALECAPPSVRNAVIFTKLTAQLRYAGNTAGSIAGSGTPPVYRQSHSRPWMTSPSSLLSRSMSFVMPRRRPRRSATICASTGRRWCVSTGRAARPAGQRCSGSGETTGPVPARPTRVSCGQRASARRTP